MNNLYSGVYKGLILATVITFILSGFTSGDTAYGSLVAGYSTLTLAVLMIIVLVLMAVLKLDDGKSGLNTIINILSSSGHFLLLLSLIGFVLYMIIYYKNIIKGGHVSHTYYNFTTLTTMLILLQCYLIYTNLDSDKFSNTGTFPKTTTSILYLLCVVTWMSSLIIYITLKYYNTDGFAILKDI